MKGKEKEDLFCVKVIFVTNMYLCVDCPKIITSVNLDDANTYSVDSLLELNEKVPFQRDTEWSKNCEEVIEKSTKNPQDIDYKNIHKYFRKLRIVNKNVCIKISL